MYVMIFALRGTSADLISGPVRARHPQDDVYLVHVRNATRAQLEKILSSGRPNRLYFAELKDNVVELSELAAGRLSSAAYSEPLPAGLASELAAAIAPRLPSRDENDPDGEPPRHQVRRLLEQLIPQHADFDLFLEKHVPKVWSRIGSGMNRVAKTNELLSIVPTHKIMPLLADRPDYERLRLGLVHELYYSEYWAPETRST